MTEANTDQRYWMSRKITDRDWTEDFDHENGCYSSICMTCEAPFFGHKRRFVCKRCSNMKGKDD